MDKADACTISFRLRELRRARGLTVDTLAKKMGENSQKVGRIERGTRSITFDYLVKVSKALETPVEAFIEDKKEEEKKPPLSNILNDIVIQIEGYCQKYSLKPDKKALMISKTYELAVRFPEENRKLFLSSAIELLDCLEN
jgi:transcriptional regulator with XRE-family HTH domain